MACMLFKRGFPRRRLHRQKAVALLLLGPGDPADPIRTVCVGFAIANTELEAVVWDSSPPLALAIRSSLMQGYTTE